jgi:hypothetical protein
MSTRTHTATTIAFLAGVGLAFVAPQAALARAKHHAVHQAHVSHPGVRYGRGSTSGGSQALVSDGYGTGFGFHHLPYSLHVAALHERNGQAAAVRSAVTTDALTQGYDGYGFYGDSVYGRGAGASYGVFSGSDGYGSPYFAGYYGRGEGADYGVFGHAYE